MGLTSIADASLAWMDADCLPLICCTSQLGLLCFYVPKLIIEDLSLLLAEVSRHGPRSHPIPQQLWQAYTVYGTISIVACCSRAAQAQRAGYGARHTPEWLASCFDESTPRQFVQAPGEMAPGHLT